MIPGQMGMNDGSMHVKEFFAQTPDLLNWQIWTKPQGAKMVYMFGLGAGGGGGGGWAGATSTLRCGGGGGTGGTYAKLVIPAFFLPDVLYIYVPCGAAGGVGAANAWSGAINNATNMYGLSNILGGGGSPTFGSGTMSSGGGISLAPNQTPSSWLSIG